VRRADAQRVPRLAHRRLVQSQPISAVGQAGETNGVRKEIGLVGRKRKGRAAPQSSDYLVSTDLPHDVPVTETELRALEILLGNDLGMILKLAANPLKSPSEEVVDKPSRELRN
jgi:hypothetical protein